jgi:hypothetical protein
MADPIFPGGAWVGYVLIVEWVDRAWTVGSLQALEDRLRELLLSRVNYLLLDVQVFRRLPDKRD